jgi:hypothetical protein
MLPAILTEACRGPAVSILQWCLDHAQNFNVGKTANELNELIEVACNG